MLPFYEKKAMLAGRPKVKRAASIETSETLLKILFRGITPLLFMNPITIPGTNIV